MNQTSAFGTILAFIKFLFAAFTRSTIVLDELIGVAETYVTSAHTSVVALDAATLQHSISAAKAEIIAQQHQANKALAALATSPADAAAIQTIDAEVSASIASALAKLEARRAKRGL